jgi:hypothetical protein
MADQQQVTVVDVRIPFGSMVVLLFKVALAAIPAMILLAVAAAILSSVVGAALLGMIPQVMRLPQAMPPVAGKNLSDKEKCEAACDSTGGGVDCYANCAQRYPAQP